MQININRHLSIDLIWNCILSTKGLSCRKNLYADARYCISKMIFVSTKLVFIGKYYFRRGYDDNFTNAKKLSPLLIPTLLGL